MRNATSPTTSYGTWNNHGDTWTVSLGDTVGNYLGEFAADYDVPAIIQAYKAAINEALPEGFTLAGGEFYGPHPRISVDGYPVNPDGILDIAVIVAGVDLGAIVDQHDTTMVTE